MDMWLVVLLFLAGIVLAFPLAGLVCAALGWGLLRWENSNLNLWFKRRRLREGMVLVHWPAADLREDICVVDLSRIDQDEVGVKRRQYCVMRGHTPPAYGDVEYVSLRDV